MRVWVAWLGIVGCTDSMDPVVPPDSGTSVSGDDDTAPPAGDDEGSLVVLSWLPSASSEAGETLILGLFAESRRGFLNLAQCVGSSVSFCATELPEEPDGSVTVSALDPQLIESLSTLEVGPSVRLGGWQADYQFDSERDLGFYYGIAEGAALEDGPLGLSLGGSWGEYAGTDDIRSPTAMILTSHDPLRPAEFSDAGPIPLRWEPGAIGEVFLYVSSPAEQRLYRLADDGEFDLDLRALGLHTGDPISLILGRWSLTSVDIDGNEVALQIQSNQRLEGTFRELGSRAEIDALYDRCSDAVAAPTAASGSYFGSTQGFGRDLYPRANGCTGSLADGVDGLIPIDVPPGELLTVTYQQTIVDGSLYLLTDCTEESTCLAGSDETGPAGLETAVYFNDSGSPIRVYAVLDSFNNINGDFNVDIAIGALGGDVLVQTCAEAIEQGPAETGAYHGTLAGHADLLDPSCASPAGGGEGLTQVYLEPGQRLTATVTATGGDPELYLLYNCSIADSCFLSADVEGGGTETLVYVNLTGFSEFLYLALDSELNLGEYLLDITIQ